MTEQIYTSRKLKRGFFGFKVERPQAAPGKVLVLTGGGAPIVLWPGQKPTAGEAAWNRYETVIEIDTGRREFSFAAPVSAKGGDVAFQMTFSAGYKVADPVKVLNEGLLNPEPALRRVITESVSRITEQFDSKDVAGATAAVRDMVDKGKYTEKLPFELSTVNVRLEMDSRTREFVSQRTQQEYDAALTRASQELTKAKADLVALQADYDQKIQKNQTAHEIEMERTRKLSELGLAKDTAESDISIRKMRIDSYKDLIQGNVWDVIVLRLAENPNDVGQVSDMIMQMHGQQLAADIAVLDAMIKGDRIEEHHLKDVVGDLVRRLRGGAPSAPTIGPAPERKQLASGGDQVQRAEDAAAASSVESGETGDRA